MPLVTVRLSEKSGAAIEPGTGARVRVMFYDPDRPDMRADLTEDEVAKLIKDYKMRTVETRSTRRSRS